MRTTKPAARAGTSVNCILGRDITQRARFADSAGKSLGLPCLTMKIAIDVHSLESQSAGNETYFQQLLSSLVKKNNANQYSLLYTHAAAPLNTPVDQRFNWVAVSPNRVRRILFDLPRALRRIKPDVCHCQYIRPPGLKCKTVVSIHDLAFEHFPETFSMVQRMAMKTLVRQAAMRADRILTISHFSADDISRTYGVPREKISVAYPAVSPAFQPGDKQKARIHLAARYKLENEFLLYVGRIQARKNLVQLIEAYARVRQRGATAKLVIVGKSDYDSKQVFDKIADLGLHDAVFSPGYVPQEDLPLFYQGAEAFVFPSFFEGFGLPVLESMACGTPAITSVGSSLEELAGGAALLVDPHSVDSMVNAMERVLGSADLRADLAARGLGRSADFTIENFAGQVLQVYASLVR